MTNEQIISKMKEDMKMRGFSHWTEESYLLKTKDIMKYFRKPMEEVTTEELREFLLKYLKDERKLSDRSINYYNSVIRFIYEVTLDKLINKRQLPMRKKKKTVYKVLTKEELSQCQQLKKLSRNIFRIIKIFLLFISLKWQNNPIVLKI